MNKSQIRPWLQRWPDFKTQIWPNSTPAGFRNVKFCTALAITAQGYLPYHILTALKFIMSSDYEVAHVSNAAWKLIT
jgi:hypothetical protein